jgi:hypothetical protein
VHSMVQVKKGEQKVIFCDFYLVSAVIVNFYQSLRKLPPVRKLPPRLFKIFSKIPFELSIYPFSLQNGSKKSPNHVEYPNNKFYALKINIVNDRNSQSYGSSDKNLTFGEILNFRKFINSIGKASTNKNHPDNLVLYVS